MSPFFRSGRQGRSAYERPLRSRALGPPLALRIDVPLLSAYKRVGLPEELHIARPKRLRFCSSTPSAKLSRHARQTLLRCAKAVARTLTDRPRTRFALNRPALPGV